MTTENHPKKKYQYQEYAEIDTGYQAVRWNEPIIYDLSRKGSINEIVPEAEDEIQAHIGDVTKQIPEKIRRKEQAPLPELSEAEVMRHYLRLSQQTFGYDSGVNIGLGTCTMKYSPKLNDQLSKHPSIAYLHPLQPEETFQGLLEIMYDLRNWLCELSGMDEFSLQPRGGGHGVYSNACIMRAYHRANGNSHKDEVITCAVSHPCNAGCPSAAGFKVIELHPNKETGDIGMDQLEAIVSDRTAGLFLTAPYDTGVFDSQLGEYAKLIHSVGGLVSLDQANFNGVMTRMRAGDIGADLMHFNLHKSFSTPHGSAGPATGAIGVKKELRDFLPVPVVEFDGSHYHLNYDIPKTIGKTGVFYGVVMNALKAYAWIMSLGEQGLRQASEWAVINNNYLIKKMIEVRGVDIAWPNRGKLQEARFHLQKLKEETGIGTAEVNLRIADFGIQTYFESHEPVIVAEPVTPEASEGASKEDIDRFVEAFHRISEEAYTNPEIVRTAPHRCAIHQTNLEPLLEPKKTIVTWRAYKKKGIT
ncbi:MAG: aminomethyl-transferring glycine dehydrogenase subunit GcvPB [Anaerolineaceae bacterium]|nr:aminomethyl-transferring glycine dehydrogenase subunit GcvPB [Anaerolineaceae bacterium]